MATRPKSSGAPRPKVTSTPTINENFPPAAVEGMKQIFKYFFKELEKTTINIKAKNVEVGDKHQIRDFNARSDRERLFRGAYPQVNKETDASIKVVARKTEPAIQNNGIYLTKYAPAKKI